MLNRARRGGIRPISIGRALLQQLDTQFDALGSDGVLAPSYVITLNPHDATGLDRHKTALLDELRQAVTHHASIEGYRLSTEVEIRLDTAESVKRGTCQVAPSSLPHQDSTQPHPRPTPISEPPTQATGAKTATIVLGNGERVPLLGDLAIVGRQSDCQVVIDDNNVSRQHAEIRRTPDGWVITDRGSTNGSKVNGEKLVDARLLVNGDTIAFGSALVHFENS